MILLPLRSEYSSNLPAPMTRLPKRYSQLSVKPRTKFRKDWY
jgi:hypothetical protein